MFENTEQENARALLELNSEQFRILHKGELLDLYTYIYIYILSANAVRILQWGKLE